MARALRQNHSMNGKYTIQGKVPGVENPNVAQALNNWRGVVESVFIRSCVSHSN